MDKYTMQQMQLQRVIGELKVLQVSLYDPLKYNKKGDDNRDKMDFIENIITDLKENIK